MVRTEESEQKLLHMQINDSNRETLLSFPTLPMRHANGSCSGQASALEGRPVTPSLGIAGQMTPFPFYI